MLISLKRFIGYRTLKTAVGAGLAILLSQLLGLEYAVNSGIIVILTIQSTRKRSMDLAAQRLMAAVLALACGALVFRLFGFQAGSFAIYLALFIPLAVQFGWNDAIVPCSVLVSHLLAVRSVAPPWLLNEFMQMVIGAGTGLIMNLHIPSVERELRQDLLSVEEGMGRILLDMAACLRSRRRHESDLVVCVEQNLERSSALVRHELFNYPHGRAAGSQALVDLRSTQLEILKHMGRYLQRIDPGDACCLQAAELTELTAKLIPSEQRGTAEPDFEGCRRSLWTDPLPGTSQGQKSRAALNEYLNDLELLRDLKRNLISEPFPVEESRQNQKK